MMRGLALPRLHFDTSTGTSRTGWAATLGAAAVAVALALAPTDANAFRIYNETNRTVTAKVSGGNFAATIDAGKSASCPSDEKRCNSSQVRATWRTADIEIGSSVCHVRMRAGGSVKVEALSRTYAGPIVSGPKEPRCTSRSKPDGKPLQVTDIEPRLVGQGTRDVRFLATADPQYDNAHSQFGGLSQSANVTLATMNGLLREGSIRGALVAGDLTQGSRPIDEYMWYRFAIDGLGSTRPDPHYLTSHDIYYPPKPGGLNRFYFDTVGNLDGFEPRVYQQAACNVASAVALRGFRGDLGGDTHSQARDADHQAGSRVRQGLVLLGLARRALRQPRLVCRRREALGRELPKHRRMRSADGLHQRPPRSRSGPSARVSP